MTGPLGNSEFCFPRISMSGNIEILGKQNSLFPLGPVIKCLLSAPAMEIKMMSILIHLTSNLISG